MDGHLHDGVRVLHAEGGAIAPEFAEGAHVVAGQAPRVHLDAHLRGRIKTETGTDRLAQPADDVRRQKGRRTAAEMHLHDPALRVEHRLHLRQFLF